MRRPDGVWRLDGLNLPVPGAGPSSSNTSLGLRDAAPYRDNGDKAMTDYKARREWSLLAAASSVSGLLGAMALVMA